MFRLTSGLATRDSQAAPWCHPPWLFGRLGVEIGVENFPDARLAEMRKHREQVHCELPGFFHLEDERACVATLEMVT